MYQAVLQYMRDHQMEAVQVTTGADSAHAPARRAYERAGFRHHTESITYYMEL
jgi:RimJ/RimL family protein N-acetyltransferase